MPARVLDATPVPVRPGDVVAKNAASDPGFVSHVAVVTAPIESCVRGTPLSVSHMRPPLALGEAHCPDVWGCIPTTESEWRQIDLFLDEQRQEYEEQRIRDDEQYVVRPHVREVRAEDGTLLQRRFSCAGLVVEAFREVGIDLVATDEALLPNVSLETLCRVYELLAAAVKKETTGRPGPLRRRIGLDGPGPWPVLLPGHVLHALRRSTAAIRSGPYRVQSGDERFP